MLERSAPMKVFPPPRPIAGLPIPVLRALHWLMALLIFVALAARRLGDRILPRGDHPRSEFLFVHKSSA